MIHLLAFLALAGSAQQAISDEEAQFNALITESNQCLKQQIDTRIPVDKIRLLDEERSAIRMAAASACNHYNGAMAKFVSEYRSGVKTLAQVTEEMLVTSLRIADAMAVTRVKSNAESQ